MRTLDCKFNVIRNGAVYGQVYPVAAPRLRCNDSALIKQSFSGEFLVDPNVDWLTDRIQPVLIIDGTEYPLGIFLPATVPQKTTNTSRTVSIEAYDQCWLLRDNYTDTQIYLAAGTSYLDAVETMLAKAGVGIVQKTPSTATLQEARQEWPVGTSYLTIINQLLSEINYKPLWFNGQGAAVLEPIVAPTADSIKHTLDSDEISSLLLPDMTDEIDIFSAPNYFIVVCSNPDKTVMSATAENSNPQSPLSTMRRGRRITKVVKVNNIASAEELQIYANNLRDESMYSGEVITVKTALHPGYGVDDVTALHYDDVSAVCLETAWEMQLSTGGTMTHTLKKVVVNIG